MPEPFDLPFEEAIAFFRQKVSLPTERWTDIWEGMHSRAFVVAGAKQGGLLSDLRAAIDDGISKGSTIADFRKAFDQTVSRHGWSYKGGRGWRTGVIFNTNLRVAYAEGQYEQMRAVKSARPYLRYVGGLSEDPRPLHLKWNGTILPFDDPWWNTHWPPNGWGCKCQVVSHSASELEREGLRVTERAPDDGTYEWTNPDTGEVISVPNGIDPGWAYNPGRAAWGSELSDKAMAGWKAKGAAAWKPLTPGNWQSEGRPARIPVDPARARLDRTIGEGDLPRRLSQILGGEEKIYSFQAGEFRYDVLVNAKSLARHIDPARAAYLPLLPETLEDPFEVWQSFEQHQGTGRIVLRHRIIKSIDTGEAEGMIAVTNAVDGMMEAWTVVPTSDLKYLNDQRRGRLIWNRE